MAEDRTHVTPLSKSQLELCISLVQRLSDLSSELRDSDIWVPDETAKMAIATELSYDDIPWLITSGRSQDKIRLVHPTISAGTGGKLGVRSLRMSLVMDNFDSLDFAIPHGEAFGQAEPLTRRLKHILELYPEGPGLLCELIQNADDAGASKLSFVLSDVSYGTTSLLGTHLKEWQG